jgi:hypothetical protein
MPRNIASFNKPQMPASGPTYQPIAANPSGPASPSAGVPSPGRLIINGHATSVIDVRSMTLLGIVGAINGLNLPGIMASISNGQLIISGIETLDGDGDLRAFLGI